MDLPPLHARKVNAEDLPLDRLASNQALSQPEKIAAVSHAFEAVFLRQILQETQKPVFPSKFISDSATDGIYRGMVVEQLADSISKSGALGLASSISAGLQRLSDKADAAPPKAADGDGGDAPPGPVAPKAASRTAQGSRRAPAIPGSPGSDAH